MPENDLETGTSLRLKFNEQGLVPAIVQDIDTGQVLMVGWMNAEAFEQTLASGQATFYSRSRKKVWVKGETSGHVQEVVEVRVDCDQDVVLLRCRSRGPCCHAGYQTCFYRRVEPGGKLRFMEERVFDPGAVYKD
jgi:phosphoribosyl-AMP cyclohydrolase